jgi:ribosome-binding factor A
MNSFRTDRVGSLIQEKIGELIVEGRVKDPRVDSFLTVTRVTVSRDLSYADVFISSYKSEAGLAKGIEGLQSAAGFIQSQLNKTMRLRHIPHLRFHEDRGVREGFDLVQKIDGLADNKPAEEKN